VEIFGFQSAPENFQNFFKNPPILKGAFLLFDSSFGESGIRLRGIGNARKNAK
jgi:hypothetical protein